MSDTASAQLAPAAAMLRTDGSVRILQPAMIATSQDLMFAVTAPAVASLTTIAASPVSSSSLGGASATASSGATRGGSNGPGGRGASLLGTPASSLSTRVPVPAQATFLVTGDAGQSISVTVPTAVDLTREGGGATALLTTSDSLGDGPQFLGGNFASAGALSFNVGGQVTLARVDAHVHL